MKFNSKTIHGNQYPDKAYASVMPPIYQTSTYVIPEAGVNTAYGYSRTANPTRTAFENAMASLESGESGFAFASGMAAIDAVMRLIKPKEEVVVSRDLYGGTHRLFTKIGALNAIRFHFVDMMNLDEVSSKINEQTKMIWAETPTNPTMQILDLQQLGEIAKRHGLLFAVDNTFASPYLQRPLELGADIVMHSATKYIGGHSDIVAGVLVVQDTDLAHQIKFIQNATGAICGPMDSFLALRGIKTLHVRMQRHCENTAEIARFLANHRKVTKVLWPGFETHPNHEIAKAQMHDFGGMLSFETKEGSLEYAKALLKRLKYFVTAESLGGVESLAGIPALMTHAGMSTEERQAIGISDGMIRLSVGIEDVEDLIQDLSMALEF